MPKSLTLRLALFFGVVSTAALLAIGYLVTVAVDRHFIELDRAELDLQKDHARDHVQKALATSVEQGATARQLEESLAAEKGVFVLVAGADGRIVYATPGAHFPREWQDGAAKIAGEPEVASWEEAGRYYRGIRDRLTSPPAGGEATIAIAINIDRHHEFMHSFYRTLWTVIALGILFTGLLGWFAARRGLEPVRSMARVAQNITASRLAERLDTGTLPVELVDLAQAFNAMLSRLEDSFRRLSEFSSDLAHELRTPISNLIMHSQVSLSRSRSADEYRDVLYSNVEEFERLARTISDMLFLAKADNGLIVPSSEEVDLASEVRNLFDYYDALVEERGVQLSMSGEGKVRGERLMVRRAINNLLSNAVNHSPPGGRVDVRIDRTDSAEVRLCVENRGETIAPEHLARIFDRFYRVDPARQRLSEGAGLGLAITKSIVAAHRGTVHALSRDGVTRIELRFPATVSGARRAPTLASPSAGSSSARITHM